ncbi:MAG: PilN domain-containing protein [Deltaproteobacteria bacterium]|nr:PilN domain-containing protein [Deltaproteobacteria bacterium]
MIRINLARERKKGGGKLDLKNLDLATLVASLKTMLSKRGGVADEGGKKFDLKNSAILKLAAVGAAIYLVQDQLDGYRKEALAKVDKSIAAVEREAEAQQQKLAQLQGFEAMKAQLESDERAIRTKLEVLAKVADGRTDPSRIMLQISQAMPDQLWLTDLRVAANEVSFAGQTPSYAQVSDFLKSISSSSFFSDIALKGIEENLGAARDVRIQNFTITAKRKAAQ